MCGKKKRPVAQAKAEKKAKRPPAAKAGRLGEFSLFLPKGGAKARPQGQAEKEIVCLACGSGDAEEGERRLAAALSDMEAERARIEKEAGEEKSKFLR